MKLKTVRRKRIIWLKSWLKIESKYSKNTCCDFLKFQLVYCNTENIALNIPLTIHLNNSFTITQATHGWQNVPNPLSYEDPDIAKVLT